MWTMQSPAPSHTLAAEVPSAPHSDPALSGTLHPPKGATWRATAAHVVFEALTAPCLSNLCDQVCNQMSNKPFHVLRVCSGSDSHWIHSLYPVYLLHQRSDAVQQAKPELQALVSALRDSLPPSDLGMVVSAVAGLPASVVQEML